MAKNHKYYFSYLLFFFIVGFYQSKGNDVEIIEKLSEYIPQDITLLDENGDSINLLTEIQVPTVLSFVYFTCPGICTSLMDEIQLIIDNSDLKLGENYQVFTISFDPKDTPDKAYERKQNYTNDMVKGKEAKQWWKFLTGDSANISKVTESVGFQYQRAGEDFIHKLCMIIINKEGKIIRYNMGVKILPIELKISFIEGEKGNTLPKTYKKDEYCYPAVAPGFQRLNRVTNIIGGLIVLFSILLFIFLILKPKVNNH